MAINIMTIKFDNDKELFVDEEFKKFIINKKINSYKAEFFYSNDRSYWTILIDYEILTVNAQTHVKNKENLTEQESLLFTRLKEWRKIKADAKGFPVYLVATNEQVLTMIRNKAVTLEALKNIPGFGAKRIESYGKASSNYKFNPTDSYKSVMNLGNTANAFFYSEIAMIPVSIVFVIPAIVLFAMTGKDAAYQRDIDNIKRKIENYNLSNFGGICFYWI